MWNKLISMILAIAFFSLFILNSAEAGSKQRYMWYGAGIGFGAVCFRSDGPSTLYPSTSVTSGGLLSTAKTSLQSSTSTTT